MENYTSTNRPNQPFVKNLSVTNKSSREKGCVDPTFLFERYSSGKYRCGCNQIIEDE